MSVVSPAGQEGGRSSTSGQEDSGRIILPFWVSPPCLLSVRCFFFFSFFLTEEGLEPAFPSIPLRTACSHEALWLALASTLLPSCNHSGQLGSSESLGKWQWLGWTVARGSPGLRTQAPSVRRQLGCLRRSDRPQQGGTAGIWWERGMGEVFFNGGPWSSLITSSWRESLGQKLLNTGALSFSQGTLYQPWNSAWGHRCQSKVLEASQRANQGGLLLLEVEWGSGTLGGCEASVCRGLRTEPVPDLFCDQTQRNSLSRTTRNYTQGAWRGRKAKWGRNLVEPHTKPRSLHAEDPFRGRARDGGLKRHPGDG